MARKARERAMSGIYYAEAVGNNKLIFIEADDYRYFLSLARQAAEEDFSEICAYALFPEHVHFVLKEGLNGISEFMRKILPKYTAHYNGKYGRDGKLFYDRFKSQPLESEEETLNAVRYIHRLPLSDGASGGLKYEWSSYSAYDRSESSVRGGTVMMICGDSPQRFRLEMDAEATPMSPPTKPTDEQVAQMLRNRLAGMSAEEVENMSEEKHAELVRYLHDAGVSIRRLALLLGVGKSEIERCLKTVRGGENK